MVHHPYVYAEMLKAQAAEARRHLLAGEYRLDRRAVRRRQAHQHPAHARAAESRPHGQAATRWSSGRTRSSGSRCRRRARACRRRSSIRPSTWPQPRGVLPKVRRAGRALHRELQADQGRLPRSRRGLRSQAAARLRRGGEGFQVDPFRRAATGRAPCLPCPPSLALARNLLNPSHEYREPARITRQ